MNNDEYLTVSEARALMKVSDGKMTSLLQRGELPYIQSSWDRRIKLIKRSDVEAWIERAGPRPTFELAGYLRRQQR